MRHAQTVRFQQSLDPTPGASDMPCEIIQTSGLKTLMVVVGNNNADTCSEFKLTETDDAINFNDVPGTVFGTDAVDIEGTSCPLASTGEDDTLFVFMLDCAGRKKYIKPEITTTGSGDRTYVLAIGFESPEPSLLTNASMGLPGAKITHVINV